MATIKFVNGKWHCYTLDGKDWCAFSRQEHAVEVAKAHGWMFMVE